MAPDSECLALADAILAAHPEIQVDRITLGYTVQHWLEREEEIEAERVTKPQAAH